MIDYVKFWVDRNSLESHINNTRTIDLKQTYEVFTGVLESCPQRGNYFNMGVVLTCQGAFTEGSIHQFTNLLNGKEKQNYNDLCYHSANRSIIHLIDTLNLSGKTSLTNLEFGLNINMSADPQLLLDYNLLMYDFAAPSRNEKYRSRGDLKAFSKTDYHIKIYNKSKQYGIANHILRVELKIISKRKLEALGIRKLEDLTKESVVRRLYAFLYNELEKLLIIDDYSKIPLSQEDKNSLNAYTNPHYWMKLSRDSSYKVRTKRIERLNALLTKYGLDTLKKEILTKVSAKFSEMMGSPQSIPIAA